LQNSGGKVKRAADTGGLFYWQGGTGMIGNPIPWGNQGWVILEEGKLNPKTLQLDVSHYLVVTPAGSTVSGTFTLDAAKQYILEQQIKLSENE